MSFYGVLWTVRYALCLMLICFTISFVFLRFSFAFERFRCLLVYKTHVDYSSGGIRSPLLFILVFARVRVSASLTRDSATVPRSTSTTDLPMLDSRLYRVSVTDLFSRL